MILIAEAKAPVTRTLKIESILDEEMTTERKSTPGVEETRPMATEEKETIPEGTMIDPTREVIEEIEEAEVSREREETTLTTEEETIPEETTTGETMEIVEIEEDEAFREAMSGLEEMTTEQAIGGTTDLLESECRFPSQTSLPTQPLWVMSLSTPVKMSWPSSLAQTLRLRLFDSRRITLEDPRDLVMLNSPTPNLSELP